MTITFGSLFSGIGGFDLGLERAGLSCAWQVEIDKKCRDILGRHWPDVPKYEDVRNVGKRELGAVDVICGGFPCQDLSVAGQRAGLAGERSGLWFEFHRILAELAPGWVVIENVPGLLSSNKGRDFAVILRGLAQLGYGVCWRILDAQYFGVPQRRRRVFIVGSLGNGRSAQVLFERESSAWDPPPSRETGQGVAGTIAAGAHPGNYNGRDAGRGMFVAAPLTNSPYADNDAQHTKLVAYQCHGSNVGPMGTLREGNGRGAPDTIAAPLTAEAGKTGKGDSAQCVAFDWQSGGDVRHNVSAHHTSALSSSQTPAVSGRWGVRRLVPEEGEALQGFERGWTADQSDSARYRQLGNAVEVDCAEWLGRQLLTALEADR